MPTTTHHHRRRVVIRLAATVAAVAAIVVLLDALNASQGFAVAAVAVAGAVFVGVRTVAAYRDGVSQR